MPPRRRTHLMARLPLSSPHNVAQPDLGTMTVVCPHCDALHFLNERISKSTISSPHFSKCCADGKVDLPPLGEAPMDLQQLYTSPDQAATFLRDIRNYNNMLSFTSLGGNLDSSVAGQQGVYSFRLQGALHHRMGSLLPATGQAPAFAQIYFCDSDPQQQLAWQLPHAHGHCDIFILGMLQQVMLQHNPYAQLYVTAGQRSRQEEVAGRMVNLRLSAQRPLRNDHRYNNPTANEIGAIIIDGTGEGRQERDIVIERQAGGLFCISDLSPHYLPLRYPVLLPFGTDGWHTGIPIVEGQGPARSVRVTRMQFYAYHLHFRQQPFTTLHRARNLLQEFVVDAWAQVEQDRLDWQRRNQSTLRADLYHGLQDAMANDTNLHDVGQRRVILASSFTGSPRQMSQLYHDAMAVVAERGKPDLFITMTCNPTWVEIQQALLPGQTAQDRPDIVARVFHLRLGKLMEALLKHEVLGRVQAHVHVVEFQKRGLPHAHILLILHPDDKPRTPADIDSITCAEFPDAVAQPELLQLVLRNMVHGPCGPGRSAPCMAEGSCTKRYPRRFVAATTMSEDGYPTYRRRDDGRTFQKPHSDFLFDNRWVVPYNPFLTVKYQAHINVEVASSITSVKYLYKYVYKGHDRMRVRVEREGQEARDEVQEYLDGRYVSAQEAMTRLLDMPVHGIDPNVVRLQVHLPEQQLVVFNPNEPPPSPTDTKLTAFFKACAQYPDVTAGLTYAACPSKLVWHPKEHKWKPRSAGYAVGRLYAVPPTAGERFYLRMLLNTVQQPTSFEALRTHGGQVLPTFKAACEALGLLENDSEWHLCLTEASHSSTGPQLRQLFVLLITECAATNPLGLWQAHQTALSEDAAYRLGIPAGSNTARCAAFALRLIQAILIERAHTLEEYGLPLPDPAFASDGDGVGAGNPFIRHQLDVDAAALNQQWSSSLTTFNEGQRAAWDAIEAAYAAGNGALFFLDGPGGTGKTYLENALLARVRSQGHIALAVASSGVAAILLSKGTTVHSRFHVPLQVDAASTCSIPKQSDLAEMLRNVRLLIWDEAPMQHKHIAQAVDRSLRDIRSCDQPFGGIVVVFAGDWRQTLPVIPHAADSEIASACLTHAPFWPSVTTLRLTTNMRLAAAAVSDPQSSWFAQWLLAVGNGDSLVTPQAALQPGSLVASQAALWQSIYEGFPGFVTATAQDRADFFATRVILAPLNAGVRHTNQALMQQLPGEAQTLLSADSALDPNGGEQVACPPEYLNSINVAGLPQHALSLKIGAPVILLRNLDPTNGLCNGTRLIVKAIHPQVVTAMPLQGGDDVFIPRITLSHSGPNSPFTLMRRQFPLHPAFAMTINKAQGQSVARVGLDLSTPAFAHGQLYVALSRVTNPRALRVLLPQPGQTATSNVVMRAVLEQV